MIYLRNFIFSFAISFMIGTSLTLPSLTAGEALPPFPSSVTLEDVCQKVLTHYPRLKAQNAKLDEAIAAKYEAYTALLPKIEGVGSVTTGDDPVYVFGSLLRQEKFAQGNFSLSSLNSPRHRTNFNFALEAQVPLFNAFETFSKIRTSKALQKSASGQADFTKAEAMMLGAEIYLRNLAAAANTKTLESVKKSALTDIQQAEELKNKGMVLGADFYAAKIILSQIKSLTLETKAAQKSSLIIMNILMGEPEGSAYSLSGNLPGKNPESMPLDQWMEDAVAARKDLAALQALIDAKRAAVLREKMSFLPRVFGFGMVSEDSHDLKTGGENFIMGFKSSMDVMDIGYWPRLKKTEAAVRAAEEDHGALKDSIRKDVVRAVNSLEAIIDTLPLSEESFRDATEAVSQTETLYREGKKSIADLLEIRRIFLETAIGRNRLLFQREITYLNLLFLSGTLDETSIKHLSERVTEHS